MCVTFPQNDIVYTLITALFLAITLIYIEAQNPSVGEIVNCEHEGRNVEDPYTQLLYGKDGIIIDHIPCTISCVCMLILRHSGAIQCTVTGQIKYSYDLLQGGQELPCTFRFTILLTLYSHNRWLTVTCYLAKNLIWHA